VLSKANRASKPVRTNGLNRELAAQRATIWSKNGSRKCSADRSAQSMAGALPERSTRTGVQRASSEGSIIGESDQKPAGEQLSGEFYLLGGSSPGSSHTRKASVCFETNRIAAS
jgi:hypothetical protein